MAKQYFEFKDKTSSKFWEIYVKGKEVTVRYGRIGTDGQAATKEFSSPAAAAAYAEKVVAEKVKKGYTKPSGAGTSAKSSPSLKASKSKGSSKKPGATPKAPSQNPKSPPSPMKVNAGWERQSKDKTICRWFIAWEKISTNEIAGAVAGYGGGGSFIVERFYAQLSGTKLAKLWIDLTDRISNSEINFEACGSKALEAAERGLDCIWEWNDNENWNESDEVILLGTQQSKLSTKKDMFYLSTDTVPFLRQICEKAGLTAGPVQ